MIVKLIICKFLVNGRKFGFCSWIEVLHQQNPFTLLPGVQREFRPCNSVPMWCKTCSKSLCFPVGPAWLGLPPECWFFWIHGLANLIWTLSGNWKFLLQLPFWSLTLCLFIPGKAPLPLFSGLTTAWREHWCKPMQWATNTVKTSFRVPIIPAKTDALLPTCQGPCGPTAAGYSYYWSAHPALRGKLSIIASWVFGGSHLEKLCEWQQTWCQFPFDFGVFPSQILLQWLMTLRPGAQRTIIAIHSASLWC